MAGSEGPRSRYTLYSPGEVGVGGTPWISACGGVGRGGSAPARPRRTESVAFTRTLKSPCGHPRPGPVSRGDTHRGGRNPRVKNTERNRGVLGSQTSTRLKTNVKKRQGEGRAAGTRGRGIASLQLPLQKMGSEPRPPSWRSGRAALPVRLPRALWPRALSLEREFCKHVPLLSRTPVPHPLLPFVCLWTCVYACVRVSVCADQRT